MVFNPRRASPFLLFFLLASPTVAAAGRPLAILQEDRRLLSSPDSRTFVASLEDSPDQRLVDAERHLPQAFTDFRQALQGVGSSLSWKMYLSHRDTVFLSFPGARDYFLQQDGYPVLLSTVQDSGGAAVGFFALTLLKSMNGHNEAIIEYIMAPGANGLAKDILELLRGPISGALRIKNLYAEMEWSGRAYWAQKELGFGLSPLQPTALVDGRPTNFLDLIKENFGRFVENHEIKPSDLVQSERGAESPFLLEKLADVATLLTVKHKHGTSVEVIVLKGHNDRSKKRLPIGQAFLSADHQAREGQSHVIQVGGKSYSDQAMPPWFGVTRGCEAELGLSL